MTSHDPEIVTRFSESLRAKNRQPATVESYSRDAQDFLRFLEKSHLNINSVEPETLLWFRDYLRDSAGERENSVRRKVIGVRQFFRFLADEQVILSSPFDAMPIPERDDSLDEGLSESRLKALLDLVSETGFKNRRDRALLHLLAYEGLKASEIIDLRWRDLIQSRDVQTLSVPGLKSRTIQLQESTAQSLADYAATFKSWLESQHNDSVRASARGRSVPLLSRQRMGSDQPVDNDRRSTELDQPVHNGRRSTELDQPVDNGRRGTELDQPVDNGRRSTELDQPVDNGRRSTELDQPVHNGRRSTELDQPVHNGRRSTELDHPVRNNHRPSAPDHPVGDQPVDDDAENNLAGYLSTDSRTPEQRLAAADSRSPEQRFPWMFVAFKGKELPLVLPRMTRHGLKFMLHELGEKLGVKHLHTETLRHHAMCYHLALGRNAEDVMQHLGLRRLGNIGKHLAQYRNQP